MLRGRGLELLGVFGVRDGFNYFAGSSTGVETVLFGRDLGSGELLFQEQEAKGSVAINQEDSSEIFPILISSINQKIGFLNWLYFYSRVYNSLCACSFYLRPE